MKKKMLLELTVVCLLSVAASCGYIKITPDNDDDNNNNYDAAVTAFYVSTTGSDTNPGTADSPFLTIQKGIDAAAAASITEVKVAAGTYLPTTSIQMVAGVSILGGYSGVDWEDRKYLTAAERADAIYKTQIQYAGTYDGAYSPPTFDPSTTISATGAGITASTKIEGFTIKAKDTSVFASAITLGDGAGPTIQYNTVEGSTSATLLSAGILGLNAAGTINSNVINAGTATATTSGLGFLASTAVMLTNNIVNGGTSANNTSAISFKATSGVIANNTIDAGTASGDDSHGINIQGASSSILIYNNKISGGTSPVDNTNALLVEDNSSVTVYSNVIIGGSPGVTSEAYTVYVDGCAPALYNNTLIGGTSVVDNIVIKMINGATPTIENNLIYLAAGTGIGIQESDLDSDPLSVRNNNINGFSGQGYYDFDTTSYPWDPALTSLGNVDILPLFADYSNQDFHLLTADSNINLRGGGLDLSATIGNLDKDGTARTAIPIGATNIGAAGWSIGAYELD